MYPPTEWTQSAHQRRIARVRVLEVDRVAREELLDTRRVRLSTSLQQAVALKLVCKTETGGSAKTAEFRTGLTGCWALTDGSRATA